MTLFEENAGVLRDIENGGADLSVERTVDFSHVFSSKGDVREFIRACSSLGFEGVDTTDDEMDHFDVTVSKAMMPTCELITETESVLSNIAKLHNGRADGWGFLSN